MVCHCCVGVCQWWLCDCCVWCVTVCGVSLLCVVRHCCVLVCHWWLCDCCVWVCHCCVTAVCGCVTRSSSMNRCTPRCLTSRARRARCAPTRTSPPSRGTLWQRGSLLALSARLLKHAVSGHSQPSTAGCQTAHTTEACWCCLAGWLGDVTVLL